MKKSLSYLLLIATVVMSGLFTSCQDESQLIGTWMGSDGEMIQFKEDGECSLMGMIPGSYKESSKTITITFLGETQVWTIQSLTDNQLVVTYVDSYEEYVYNPLLGYSEYQTVSETVLMTFTKM